MTSPVKILAVDDETLNGELLNRVFRGHDEYQLTTCTSAADGMARIAQDGVDVVLLDQSMPDVTGTQFVKQVLATGRKPIFVMVTAYPEMKEVIELWNEGLVRFVVPKPWRAAQLLATIERALSR